MDFATFPLAATLSAVVFYALSIVLIAAALMVVVSRNPVHSVLFLVLAFFNAAALFLMMGAEFLAFTLIIVYVGAVAVLFLFVVMMLNIRPSEIKQNLMRHISIGVAIAFVMLGQLILVAVNWQTIDKVASLPDTTVDNTTAIGNVLYTQYIYPFQVCGLIMLVAMVGAIVLALRERAPNGKLQHVSQQLGVKVSEVLELHHPKIGAGVEL